jgi:hypothetical protein
MHEATSQSASDVRIGIFELVVFVPFHSFCLMRHVLETSIHNIGALKIGRSFGLHRHAFADILGLVRTLYGLWHTGMVLQQDRLGHILPHQTLAVAHISSQ